MQASQTLTDSEPVIKDWLMKRNCSVSPRQFVGFFICRLRCFRWQSQRRCS
ncbi:MAG: Putative transmembrane protein [uncultured Caballeronia sp.]|nr:MAG: Putative transmembrane protein [uncultured Caballeronia sp.]